MKDWTSERAPDEVEELDDVDDEERVTGGVRELRGGTGVGGRDEVVGLGTRVGAVVGMVAADDELEATTPTEAAVAEPKGGGAPSRDASVPARAMATHDSAAAALTTRSQAAAYRAIVPSGRFIVASPCCA